MSIEFLLILLFFDKYVNDNLTSLRIRKGHTIWVLAHRFRDQIWNGNIGTMLSQCWERELERMHALGQWLRQQEFSLLMWHQLLMMTNTHSNQALTQLITETQQTRQQFWKTR